MMDQALGLHEEITIIYIVDSYEAAFFTDDGQTLVCEARGETVREAFDALEKAMALKS